MANVELTAEEIQRYGRHLIMPEVGMEGQKKLKAASVLAVWSASPDRAFAKRLRRAGLEVTEVSVRARGPRGGGRHIIWLALRMS